jgi:hypothetical protein
MTTALYIEALKSFPWDDDYSDDFRVWDAWNIKRKQITRMQKLYDTDHTLWNCYAPEKFKKCLE